ncbi:hypothetical protein QWJ90_12850 [Microbacterium oryzae]|uniref:hypothetical protein n=1 Tax=Microbacterium oryzae TaxID=743009 RepID=UPI0025B1E467|nr:hypothetical protein [Microbacterium oryzae]MDN3311819.1 hypothetical protein [Microbacterium oryzae]
MELTGLVLAAIGGADLVRAGAPHRVRAAGVTVVLIAIALAGAAIGADPVSSLLLALVPAAAALGWLVTMRADHSPLGFLPVVFLGALALGAFAWSPATIDATARWGGRGAVPVALVLLAFGGALFLLESSNRVVRTALRTEDVPADGDEAPGRRRLFGPRPDAEAVSSRDVHTLRGGRLIGPLERLVLGGLLLAGAYPVVAALIAAKGIVRFPEISRDRDRGTQAEYFLVGSMVSWALALATTALVWLGSASLG